MRNYIQIRDFITKTALLLGFFSSATFGLQFSSDFTQDIKGFYPVIDEVAAFALEDEWQVGMRISIPSQLTQKLGENYDGRNGIYVFIENDKDESVPVNFGFDLSHSTINWYVVPRGTTAEEFDRLVIRNASVELIGPMIAGERVLIASGSSITLPPLALGNQVGFEITPKTSLGDPQESPKVIVPDIRFVRGQIDPNEPAVPPMPDPELPLVQNPGLPTDPIPGDPTIGQPKIFIFKKSDWEENGKSAIPIDINIEGFTLVEVNTEYVARIFRDENASPTFLLDDDTDVSDRITKPINWYLYDDEGNVIPDAIDSRRLSSYGGLQNGLYKTQTTNDEATEITKSSKEKSEQSLRLRVGFIWDPDDDIKWPIINENFYLQIE